MKSALVVAAAMMALSPVSTARAQTQLPTTTVVAPKPKPRAAVVTRAAPIELGVDPAGTSGP